jgi:hypothetical protein
LIQTNRISLEKKITFSLSEQEKGIFGNKRKVHFTFVVKQNEVAIMSFFNKHKKCDKLN